MPSDTKANTNTITNTDSNTNTIPLGWALNPDPNPDPNPGPNPDPLFLPQAVASFRSFLTIEVARIELPMLSPCHPHGIPNSDSDPH